ncbi:MAG: GTP 3',8-cyclase MoaA [Candidatus Hydrothermia bacterium]
MKDRFDRNIEYVRLSVTDRCNLKCFYCSSYRHFNLLKHSEILTYEEILTILNILAELGIKKVRITGGEPFVRKDLPILLTQIKKIPGIEKLTITTNGTLLKNYIESLKEAKVDGVNISLDSLREDNFTAITGRSRLQDVLLGIKLVLEAEIPVKINMVYSTHNIDEVENMVKFATELKVPLRFIELMPFDERWKEDYVSESVLVDKLKSLGQLEPLKAELGEGPAKYFILRTPHGESKVGLISALSHKFCDGCNRIRISADGNLIPCMASSIKYNLRDIIRSEDPQRLSKLKEVIEKAIYNKPLEHHMDKIRPSNEMRKLGG